MKIEWRPPAWDDWLAAAGLYAAPLLAVQTGLVALAPARWIPLCQLKQWTGVPCPTCGAYRSACALADGRLATAFRLQPLLVTGGLLLLSLTTYAALTALLHRPRPHLRLTGAEWRRTWIVLGLLVLGNWAWLIADGR